MIIKLLRISSVEGYEIPSCRLNDSSDRQGRIPRFLPDPVSKLNRFLGPISPAGISWGPMPSPWTVHLMFEDILIFFFHFICLSKVFQWEMTVMGQKKNGLD